MLTITSEHPSYSDHFERKFQDKISPSDQSFEEHEEELMEFKEEQHDELKKLSLGLIKNEVITINSEIHILKITLRASSKTRFL